jgi:hypothetical protein
MSLAVVNVTNLVIHNILFQTAEFRDGRSRLQRTQDPKEDSSIF